MPREECCLSAESDSVLSSTEVGWLNNNNMAYLIADVIITAPELTSLLSPKLNGKVF